MTSLPVKEIGSVMSRTTSSNAVGGAVQSTGSVSFESVWNNQTDKNNSEEPAVEERSSVRKEDDAITRDSLQARDVHKSVIKQNDAVEDTQAQDFRDMTPEEWEEAMEVLGAAAVEMIQQIADTFGMTVEEVQGLMTELGMEQLDVLQQDGLSQLILAAGGAEDATFLLTNEEFYQQYQVLMEQLNGLLETSSETLNFDVEQFVAEVTDDAMMENPLVEVTVDDESVAEEMVSVNDKAENDADLSTVKSERAMDEADAEQPANGIGKADSEEQNDNQMQKQGNGQSDLHQNVTENKGQGENLVLQNLKAERFDPQLQQVSSGIPNWDADTMDIMKQIMDYMKIQVKPDISNLEMQLHPESLGTLQVHVASKGGVVTAQFVAQNEAVKAALESQMIQLKESFAEQGVKVEAIEVTVQTHQFEQNLEQGRGRGQNETERKTRTRRIQLDGAFSMDELEAMEAEEQLAAEMMEVNGNTVDYTA